MKIIKNKELVISRIESDLLEFLKGWDILDIFIDNVIEFEKGNAKYKIESIHIFHFSLSKEGLEFWNAIENDYQWYQLTKCC